MTIVYSRRVNYIIYVLNMDVSEAVELDSIFQLYLPLTCKVAHQSIAVYSRVQRYPEWRPQDVQKCQVWSSPSIGTQIHCSSCDRSDSTKGTDTEERLHE